MIRALLFATLLGCGAKPAPQPPIENTGGTPPAPIEQSRPPPASGSDVDGDGVLDNDDKCAEIPEDYDAYEDSDGCPDYDNDQDRIIDVEDLCPNDPEVHDGNQDDDGCPP
jgi:hypothetical protein